jgi:hypothetical protein
VLPNVAALAETAGSDDEEQLTDVAVRLGGRGPVGSALSLWLRPATAGDLKLVDLQRSDLDFSTRSLRITASAIAIRAIAIAPRADAATAMGAIAEGPKTRAPAATMAVKDAPLTSAPLERRQAVMLRAM